MRQTQTMNVSLSPELRTFVAHQIASGRYSSASEVVRAALRLLEQDERRRVTTGSQAAGSSQSRA